jgi:hypothetical protein
MIMFNIRFLPANNVWAILFGRGHDAAILALCKTKREAQETLTSWSR